MEAGTHKSPPSISVRSWSSSIYLGTRQIHPAAGTTDPSPSLRKSRMPFPSWCPGGIFEDISCPQKTPAELYLHLNVSLCVRRPKWWIWTTNSSGKVHFLLNLSGRHPQHLIAGESHLREERISGCTSHLFASQKKRMEVDFSSSWIQLCLLLLHKQNQRVPGPRASLLSATVRNTSSRVKGSDSREIIQPLTDTLSC